MPLFGSYLRQAGHVPVRRNSGGRTLRQARELIEAGRTVASFPEGALSPAKVGQGPAKVGPGPIQGAIGPLKAVMGFHKPHSGVARLALSSGAPVIPIGISLDLARIRMVEVQMEGQAEEGRIYTGGPYALTVGKPLWFEGNVADWDFVQGVSERIMARIKCLSHEGSRRLALDASRRLSQAPVPAALPQTGIARLDSPTASRSAS